MAFSLQPSKDSVVVLYKGGRLPSWERLSKDEQRAASEEHVELMLSMARKHGMMRLEGFKLMSPQKSWQRFWEIEFPTLDGAEEWIAAEIAPPYGRYGFYEYQLARRLGADYYAKWVTNPAKPVAKLPYPDPLNLPPLKVDTDSYVTVVFERNIHEYDLASPDQRGDTARESELKKVAKDHGLMRLEVFQLIDVQEDWRRVWIAELPTLEGAMAWADAEATAPHAGYSIRTVHITQKWAQAYCASWVPGNANKPSGRRGVL